jgi:hypothetical protein
MRCSLFWINAFPHTPYLSFLTRRQAASVAAAIAPEET